MINPQGKRRSFARFTIKSAGELRFDQFVLDDHLPVRQVFESVE